MEVQESKKNVVPIWEKILLTIEEASAYSNIGRDKLTELVTERGCDFVVNKGAHRLIKRKKFEDFIDRINVL